ncbi:histidine kinase, partial [bacterium]|nr:histidine kinase [bacterium]
MKSSHESRWIVGGFFVTLTATGIMSFTSYQNSMKLVNSAAQASQTNELLDALTDISVILADVESRQWRYILFEDTSELTRYRIAVRQLNLVLKKLQEPLADTLIQQQRLNALEILIIERLQLFDKAIALYGERQIKVSSSDSLIARAQENLNQIRYIITELEHTEEELINIQLEEVSFNSRVRMVIEPVGTLLTFSILLSLFGILYRQLLKRQKAEVLQQSLAQEKELSDLKLQLFSMVSHEFRTPLSSILGSSQL